MRRKILLGVATIVALVAAWVIYVSASGIPKYEAKPPELHVSVTPERIERGKKLSALLCAECHADPSTHELTGKHLTDVPPELGDVWSRNITQDREAGIGKWTDGEIAYLLRTGVRPDGQYLPPWMIKLPHASDEDLASIIAYLRSVAPAKGMPLESTKPTFLAKALTHTVMKPLEYPTSPIVAPDRSDRVAFGRYLVFSLDCFSCHSADFKKVDIAKPENSKGFMGGGNVMGGADGKKIATANLTPDDETGIGRWSEADFVRAVRKGFRPDGHVLRYPMLPKTELDEDEVSAIYTYLRTVPKIHNVVDRHFDEPVASAHPGKRLYVQYGCGGCHGEKGVGLGGLADLRHANEHYPTDADLRAWIDDAPAKKPGTRMPAWRGMIREDDYAPLMAYVRTLGTDDRSASR